MRIAACLLIVALLAGCLGDQGLTGNSQSNGTRDDIQFYGYSAFIRALHWPGLDVEIRIHSVEGYAPFERTRAALLEQVGAAIPSKQIRITDVPVQGDPDNTRRWSLNELYELADLWMAEPWPPDTAVVHMGFMNGCVAYSEERPCIGGVSIDEVAFVMLDQMRLFGENNPQFRPTPLLPSDEERWLAVHELGHSIGLIDSGVEPVVERSSDDCRCHSDRDDSVMSGNGAAGSIQIPLGDGAEAILDRATNDNLEVYYFSAEDLEDFHALQAQGADAIADGSWDASNYWQTRA